MGALLADLLPPERRTDRARAALDLVGDAVEALIRLGAPAPKGT